MGRYFIKIKRNTLTITNFDMCYAEKAQGTLRDVLSEEVTVNQRAEAGSWEA